MNVLLVGEESAGIQTLRALAQSSHRIAAVLASPQKQTYGMSSLWSVAEKLGFPTWPAKLVRDPNFAHRVRAEQVDILLNVHSLFIVNREVLAAPRYGSFNMHPGPLPRYAGLNAVSWALYRGERSHGVTIHKMEPEIDAGPIVYQSLFAIEESDTALSLSAKCVKEGLPLLLKLLETAVTNPEAIPLVPQDLTKREYLGVGVPEGGRLSWSRPAREVVNFVRACDYLPFRSPWGHPQARRGQQEIAVVKASLTGQTCDARPGTVGRLVEEGAQVACGDQWVLVSKLKIDGCYVEPGDVLKPGDLLENGS